MARKTPFIVRLYRLGKDRKEYREAWREASGRYVLHAGALGSRGELRAFDDEDAQAQVERELAAARADGFAELPPDRLVRIVVEYDIGDRATRVQLAKRHRLEQSLDDTLRMVGLGQCDGGSAGGGTMEARCLVVDHDLAERAIAAALAGTEFADYSEIRELAKV